MAVRSTAPTGADPWVRWLIFAILAVLILVLTGIAYLLYTGAMADRMPRTLVEMQLKDNELEYQAAPGDAEVVAAYARSLIEAERYSRARSVIAAFESIESTSPNAPVIVEKARLESKTGSAEEALAILDEAIEAAAAQRDAKEKELQNKGIFVRPPAPALVDAALLKSEILSGQGDLTAAIEVLTAALEENPTMADVLVWRGDLYASSGDAASARADYERALTMIPDYGPALSGLQDLQTEDGNE